jgi:hypothetical protein
MKRAVFGRDHGTRGWFRVFRDLRKVFRETKQEGGKIQGVQRSVQTISRGRGRGRILAEAKKRGGWFRVFRDLRKLFREGEEEGRFWQGPRNRGWFRLFRDLRKLFHVAKKEEGAF